MNEFVLAYLDYFSQLNDHVKKMKLFDANKLTFNFKIQDDSIDNYSLKYTQSNMTNSSMGIKCLLMILKYYAEYCQNIID